MVKIEIDDETHYISYCLKTLAMSFANFSFSSCFLWDWALFYSCCLETVIHHDASL